MKVKDFLQYFKKDGIGISVPNRSKMRLFPKSEIVEIPDMTWKEDSEFTAFCDNGINGSSSFDTFYVTGFGGDVTTLGADMFSVNGEEVSENDLSQYGLEFSISNFTKTDESKGEYNFLVIFTIIDDSLFKDTLVSSEGEIWVTIYAKGKNGKISSCDALLRIAECGGSNTGQTSIGTITISPDLLTMATEDGVSFNVKYDDVQPSSLEIQSIVTSFGDIDCNIGLNNSNATTGTANLNFYQSGISNYRGNVYDVYLTGKDINGVWTKSNIVQLDID